MTKQKKRARKATPPLVGGAAHADTGSFSCSVCDEYVSPDDLLQCKVCQALYHPLCVNITMEVFHVLQPILPVVGWVCPECVSSISERRKSIDNQFEILTTAVQKLEESQQKLMVKVDNINVPTVSVSRSTSVLNGSSSGSARPSQSDQMYRKKNVIISGLTESTDISDAEQVRAICEHHFHYKPWFDENRCRKIGNRTPKLLRITLASEHAASELIYVAKSNLKKADADAQSSVSRVYFNPYLTPTEAHQAYLRRRERRERQQRLSATASGSVLNPAAASFPAADC